jgi:hypothetical protein
LVTQQEWIVAAAVATPILAFLGALAGHWVRRRSDTELDRWRKREETMRLLRWATELAVARDADRARAGLAVLSALLDSPILDDNDVELVATVTEHVATADPPAADE